MQLILSLLVCHRHDSSVRLPSVSSSHLPGGTQECLSVILHRFCSHRFPVHIFDLTLLFLPQHRVSRAASYVKRRTANNIRFPRAESRINCRSALLCSTTMVFKTRNPAASRRFRLIQVPITKISHFASQSPCHNVHITIFSLRILSVSLVFILITRFSLAAFRVPTCFFAHNMQEVRGLVFLRLESSLYEHSQQMESCCRTFQGFDNLSGLLVIFSSLSYILTLLRFTLMKNDTDSGIL